MSSFRILLDESVIEAVRRIAHEQTDEALDRLDELGRSDAVPNVHDCRKRCKKIRGLVRLVRPSLGDRYGKINVLYRDAARELSDYRDAQALLGTFDELVAVSVDRLPDGGLGPVRDGLASRARAASTAAAADSEPIERARRLLEQARDTIDHWELDDSDWGAIAGGVTKTYTRGVDALTKAKEHPKPHRYHELRKRAKYTWYHLRLLERAAPSILEPLNDTWHALSDGLGDAHDLAVLRSQLEAEPEVFGGEGRVESAITLLDGHRIRLEKRSTALAARLYAEKPKRFVDRLGGYWTAWQEHGDEQAVGEIIDINEVGDDLDDRTVAELRTLASAVELPGRSTLHREDLVASLRAHGARSSA